MKNKAFKSTLYVGTLMVVVVISLMISLMFNIYNYVRPKVNDAINKIKTEQQDSSCETTSTFTLEPDTTKFEVIEKYTKVDSQPKISIIPMVESSPKKTIIPMIESNPKKTIKVDMSNNDTSSIRTNKTELVRDSVG
jgi:heme/copper-type cytochrome/quinol oxidase subunit 1